MTKNLSYSKHSASIAAFGKEFIKTGLLLPALHSYLSDVFKDRQTGDCVGIKKFIGGKLREERRGGETLTLALTFEEES